MIQTGTWRHGDADLAISSPLQVTAKWLERCLRTGGHLPTGRVLGVTFNNSVHASAAVLTPVNIFYAGGAPETAPSKMMLKVYHEARFEAGMREITLYREIVPAMSEAPVPDCYHYGYDRGKKTCHLLVDNIMHTHTAAKPAAPLPRRDGFLQRHENDAILRALLAFHTKWWDHPRLCEPGIAAGIGVPLCTSPPVVRETVRGRWKHWHDDVLPAFMRQFRRQIPRKAARTCKRVVAAWPDLFLSRVACGKGLTLTHNDPHLGNIFLPRAPDKHKPCIIDWEGYTRGIAAYDIAYMLIMSHTPSDCRNLECEFLPLYHDSLRACGIASYEWTDFVQDYRLAVIATLLPPLAWRRPEYLLQALGAYYYWKCEDLLR